MGLFSSNKKTTTSVLRKIRPTVLRVQNVAKELMTLSKSYEISVSSIDFNILEVQTYVRMNEETKESEWEEVSIQEVYELDDSTALLNPHFQIKQMYEIEFFSKKNENNPYKDFNLAVGANATKCKVYLSIKKGSKVSYNSRFEKELLILINKSKLRAGILINIFDEMLDDTISKISSHVRVEENVTYTENKTYLIAESYEPTATIDDKLILHYEKEKDIDEYKKMDYSDRGFIKEVKKDEVIIEYIKSKLGKPGRNCRGEFLAPKEADVSNTPTFTVDDTIREEETPTSIKYISNENGYISLDGNVYSVKRDVDIEEISFKATGNIISGLDSDVNIVVTEKDAIKDAIGNGMIVEVTEIEIDGNVGSNAKLSAQKASIGGQTHASAQVRADELDINVHKGSAYGKNIHITRLEHGIVDGDIVDISQALGGNIKAKEVTIEICASHVKATASKLIEIKKFQGSENSFIIDPLVKKDAKADLNHDNESIVLVEREIRALKEDIEKYIILVKENTASFNDVKKRLLHYKKNGVKMPDSFVKKYKQFQKIKEHLHEKKETLIAKEDQLNLLTSHISVFQDNIMDARVISRGAWVGYNEIIFKLVKPKMDVIYKPENGSTDSVFGLVELEDGEYEIQVMSE